MFCVVSIFWMKSPTKFSKFHRYVDFWYMRVWCYLNSKWTKIWQALNCVYINCGKRPVYDATNFTTIWCAPSTILTCIYISASKLCYVQCLINILANLHNRFENVNSQRTELCTALCPQRRALGKYKPNYVIDLPIINTVIKPHTSSYNFDYIFLFLSSIHEIEFPIVAQKDHKEGLFLGYAAVQRLFLSQFS